MHHRVKRACKFYNPGASMRDVLSSQESSLRGMVQDKLGFQQSFRGSFGDFRGLVVAMAQRARLCNVELHQCHCVQETSLRTSDALSIIINCHTRALNDVQIYFQVPRSPCSAQSIGTNAEQKPWDVKWYSRMQSSTGGSSTHVVVRSAALGSLRLWYRS